MLEKIIELLGEDNFKRLKDGITDIILEQIRSDLNDSYEYLINPDSLSEFLAECEEKAKKQIEKQIVANMKEKMLSSIK